MKRLLLIFPILICACGDLNLDGLTPYTPEGIEKWKQEMREIYKNPLPNLDSIDFRKGTLEVVNHLCGGPEEGCTFQSGLVALSEEKSESCEAVVHEMIHQVLWELNGNPDANHERDDWDNVWLSCYGVTPL